MASPRKSREERIEIIELAGSGAVDWDRLPPDERWTVRNIARPMAAGVSRDELARFYAQTPHWVSHRMAKLRRDRNTARRGRRLTVPKPFQTGRLAPRIPPWPLPEVAISRLFREAL